MVTLDAFFVSGSRSMQRVDPISIQHGVVVAFMVPGKHSDAQKDSGAERKEFHRKLETSLCSFDVVSISQTPTENFASFACSALDVYNVVGGRQGITSRTAINAIQSMRISIDSVKKIREEGELCILVTAWYDVRFASQSTSSESIDFVAAQLNCDPQNSSHHTKPL